VTTLRQRKEEKREEEEGEKIENRKKARRLG
jgi:hypothetical protein